jgi:hypothetical protein
LHVQFFTLHLCKEVEVACTLPSLTHSGEVEESGETTGEGKKKSVAINIKKGEIIPPKL